MNVLDPVLRTSNAGVVLEAIGCFVQLTKDLPELHAQVYERLKAPLLTLMSKSNNEGLYCLLKHAELLVFRCREVFASEYRQFYIRYDEPACVNIRRSNCWRSWLLKVLRRISYRSYENMLGIVILL